MGDTSTVGLPTVSRSVQSRKSCAVRVKTSVVREDAVVTLVVVPPDGGWAWVVLFSSFIITFIMDGTIYSLGLFLADLSVHMKTVPHKVAYANAVLVGTNLLVAPVVCGLTNRYGFRPILCIGGFLGSAVLAMSTLLFKLELFLLVFGVFGGIACSLIYIPSVIIVGFYFERWRALASAISVCGTSCGIIFFPLILNSLLSGFLWTEKFLVLSGLFLMVPVLGIAYRDLQPVEDVFEPRTEQEQSLISSFVSSQYPLSSKMFSSYRNSYYPTTSTIHEVMNESKTFADTESIESSWVASYNETNEDFANLSVYEEDAPQWKLRLRKVFRCPWFNKTETVNVLASRPLYRDDIFFTGSVYTLPEYSAKPSVVTRIPGKPSMGYHLSVSRVTTQRDLEEDKEPFLLCPIALKRILATMLDFSLLRSPSFVLLTASGFAVSLGMNVPFVYIIQKAVESGISANEAAFLLTGLGIANLFGRIISGILASIPRVNALVITYMGLFLAAIPTIILGVFGYPWSFYIFIGLFGFSVAVVPSMKTIVIVDLLGLDKLTNAFGITMMFQGLSNFLGVPIASYLVERTGSYGPSFVYCGVMIIISGLLLMPIGYVNRWEKGRSRT